MPQKIHNCSNTGDNLSNCHYLFYCQLFAFSRTDLIISGTKLPSKHNIIDLAKIYGYPSLNIKDN